MKTTKKIIQALNYIASHQPNKMVGFKKAYKLLWLIDRYSLRHYARTVSGDQYYAMTFGPVPTDAKHILEGLPTNMQTSQADIDIYLSINSTTHKVRSRKSPDMDAFSVSDVKVMDLILQHYGSMRSDDLSALSHELPEWQAYRDRIEDNSEKSSFPINPSLFFEVYDDGRGVFNEDPKMLTIAKEMWSEYNAAAVFKNWELESLFREYVDNSENGAEIDVESITIDKRAITKKNSCVTLNTSAPSGSHNCVCKNLNPR